MTTASATSPALEARNLYRFFRADDEETLALQGVSFTLERGEVLAVVGPSGSGKSTLLSCLAGIDEPAGGTVFVDGTRISHRSEAERSRIRANGVGVLFQTGNLFDHLTVVENVQLARSLGTGKTRTEPDQIIDEVGLTPRRKAYPRQLSGGESARAGLAVALANDPAVLLADEPTGELDGEAEASLLELLAARAHHGQAVLVVTHSAEVIRLADRVLELHDGMVQT